MSMEKGLATLTAVLDMLYEQHGPECLDRVDAMHGKWRGECELDRKARAAGYVKPDERHTYPDVDTTMRQRHGREGMAAAFDELEKLTAEPPLHAIPDALIAGPVFRAVREAAISAYCRGWKDHAQYKFRQAVKKAETPR